MQHVPRERQGEEAEMKSSIDISKFNLSTEDISRLIDLWIFSERDRAIMKRRLLDNVGYEKIAAEYELTDRHIKRIVYGGLDRIIPHIK